VAEGKNQAVSVIHSFRNIGERMVMFERVCSSHTKQRAKEMADAMVDLQTQIDELVSSSRKVRGVFLRLCRNLDESRDVDLSRHVPQSRSASGERKAKERELKGKGLQKQQVEDRCKAITENVKELRSHVDCFLVVWRSIQNSITTIEAKLAYFTPNQVVEERFFYTRLSKLPAQYDGLMKALELYTEALSSDRVEPENLKEKSWLPQMVAAIGRSVGNVVDVMRVT